MEEWTKTIKSTIQKE
jgi:dynein heavy chain